MKPLAFLAVLAGGILLYMAFNPGKKLGDLIPPLRDGDQGGG